MRLRPALCLTILLLLAGCSSPGKDAATDGVPTGSNGASQGQGGADGSDGSSDEATSPAPKMTTVQDSVSFSGIIGAGACYSDGSTTSCANLPSLTPPSLEGANIRRYVHDRQAVLTGGELTLSWGTNVGVGLSATTYAYRGCDPSCDVVQELATGSDMGSPTGGSFTFVVPAYALEPDHFIGVRIAPLLASDMASAHTGFEFDLTGTLDFQVPA